MSTAEDGEVARAMAVPFEPDYVLPPTLVRRSEVLGTELYYITAEDDHARVTFDGLDAIKACRGEYLPFVIGQPIQSDHSSNSGYSPLYIVERSRWLRERYAYESSHYQNWTVDRMLTEYDHYLISFHDEFIEAIAAGIWFERSQQAFASDAVPRDHPLWALPDSTVADRFVVVGITCQVRANPKPIEEILWGARYCSQPLYDFHLDLAGPVPSVATTIWYRLTVRERRQELKSILRRFGQPTAEWPGVATLAQVRPMLEAEIRAVRERRRQMGR